MTRNDWPLLDRWIPGRDEWSRPKYAGFLLSVFMVLGALPYVLTNRIAAWRGTTVVEISFQIDWDLPYLPLFVLPYYSFYLYFPIVAWVAAHESVRKQGLLFFQRMLALTWFCCIMFLLFPSEIRLRSQAVGAEGVLGVLMDELHQADAPYNSWPSIHVLQALLVVLFLRYALIKRGCGQQCSLCSRGLHVDFWSSQPCSSSSTMSLTCSPAWQSLQSHGAGGFVLPSTEESADGLSIGQVNRQPNTGHDHHPRTDHLDVTGGSAQEVDHHLASHAPPAW